MRAVSSGVPYYPNGQKFRSALGGTSPLLPQRDNSEMLIL